MLLTIEKVHHPAGDLMPEIVNRQADIGVFLLIVILCLLER